MSERSEPARDGTAPRASTREESARVDSAPGGIGSLVRATRGAVSTEYVMLVALCGLTLATVLVALGPSAVMSWAYSRHVLYGRAP